MSDHLTVSELLTSLKYCWGELGGSTCIGCPNAIPESEDNNGMCSCRFNLMKEMTHLLETLIREK